MVIIVSYRVFTFLYPLTLRSKKLLNLGLMLPKPLTVNKFHTL
jgi:hypothetical protein